MRIDNFKLEEWMNFYSLGAKYDLTSTCIAPLSVKELLALIKFNGMVEVFDEKLDYGEITGSVRLKKAISALYTNINLENITVTHGAIGANQLVFESLLEKGDEVLSIVPTYQQHYSIPKALGANVNLLFLKEENKWLPNLRELENSITSKTKLICLNNPNNPTGSVIPDDMLERIVEIAKSRNAWILSDEVYRGLNMVGSPYSKSIADLYNKGISVGSMSKAYSLAGLRVGWVCAREDLIAEINKHRQYNTISISILDDYFSALALENHVCILNRNLKIMKTGMEILNNWLNDEIYVKTNLPQGGTTALLRYKKDIPSRVLCKELYQKSNVAILPAETMDMEGFVRVGFCVQPEILEHGLKEFSKILRKV